MFRSIVFFLMLVSSLESYANEKIEVPMDVSFWVYKEEPTACNLIHAEVPQGKFYFRSETSNQVTFEYELANTLNVWKTAELSLLDPPWSEQHKVTEMSQGYKRAASHFLFRDHISETLKSVEQGKWLQLSLHDSSRSKLLDIIVPTIRAQSPIAEFFECKNRLPSMTYSDAKDTFIYYRSGQKSLSKGQRAQLSALAEYIHWDTLVTKVLIDGYTDSVGSRLGNIQISKERAEEVAQYLDKLGIGKENMQIRAHGSRYPMMTNDTEKGRSKNRRVMIRIVRNNETVVKTLTQHQVTSEGQ